MKHGELSVLTKDYYTVTPEEFWDAKRGCLYHRRGAPHENEEEARANRLRMMAAQKKAVQMLRKSNVGKRRRHTVEEVVTFLESLPEQLIADVRIVGSGLNRNDYADDENLYSVVNIEMTRVICINIFGWRYYYEEEDNVWDIEHGIIFARNWEKKQWQRDFLNKVFARYVYIPDRTSDGNVSEEQLREALLNYESLHCDCCSTAPVFYRRSEDGQLYLRDYNYPSEDEYFEDLEPLSLEEAIEQFWKSNWFVYEDYEEW